MANYRYHPDDIDENSRRYAESQVLAASDHVLDLVRQLPTSNTITSTTITGTVAATSGTAGPRRPRDTTSNTYNTNPAVTR